MDILIKSFNRPYYLDRCLQSIMQKISQSKGKVIVLDDGTPQKYLDKIQKKYPFIIIQKSEFYLEKSIGIENNRVTDNGKIPINLWTESARNASEYFLLLEDDIWFTETIDLEQIEQSLLQQPVSMIKLFWLGNPKLRPETVATKNTFFSVFRPKLFTTHPFFYQLIFRFNRFKVRQILSLFKIYKEQQALQYYTIYSVAGAVFQKKYFLSLWENHQNIVDEGLQLYHAVRFLHKNKQVTFGITHREVLQTGFMSSATNQNKNFENTTNMFVLNRLINEAWFHDDLDVMNHFPKDFKIELIEHILIKYQYPILAVEEWKNWVKQFRNQYLSFGCNID